MSQFLILLEKKRLESEKENSIIHNIEALETQQQSNPENSDQFEREIEILKSDLQEIREFKLKGAMIRAKTEAYFNFEKPTKYFCNMEKRNYTNKVIHRLKYRDKIITDQREILEIAKGFYSRILHCKRETNPLHKEGKFLNQLNITQLSNSDRKLCEGKVTFAELGQALKNMQNGKTPWGQMVSRWSFINFLGLI